MTIFSSILGVFRRSESLSSLRRLEQTQPNMENVNQNPRFTVSIHIKSNRTEGVLRRNLPVSKIWPAHVFIYRNV